MALERIPADIKADGGVARSSDPSMIQDVMSSCSVPVMAKSRIGHFYESKILEALKVDCIDESEVLTAADEAHHIDKRDFKIPFVCGAQNLGNPNPNPHSNPTPTLTLTLTLTPTQTLSLSLTLTRRGPPPHRRGRGHDPPQG